jgi:hypothetical protein
MIRIIIFLISLNFVTVKTNMTEEIQDSKNCFNTGNFNKLKNYIETRILYSGMGKYYLEYPPDPDYINDGIMRLPNHPENVYDIYTIKNNEQIVFENKLRKFAFHSKKGLVNERRMVKKEKKLAHEIFCYLLQFCKK